MVLLIDNYDSFVHNLARYIQTLGFQTSVYRNDAITISEIAQLNPSHIVISPGPGAPTDAGISKEVITHFGPHIPILGVCLGHQAIGEVFGGEVINAITPKHGKSSIIEHNQQGMFQNIPNPLKIGRYHSLVISEENFPLCLNITARSETKEIMAIQHKKLPIFGVQFHPESVLTECGLELLNNFFNS